MHWFVRGLAIACAAVSAWASLGAVAVAPGGDGVTRVGFLPHPWVLGLIVLALMVVVGLGRWSVARCAPLFGSLACLLPWLPFRVPPVFLAWQGVLAAVVWAGVLVAAVAAEPLPWPERLRRAFGDTRRAPWLATALAALVLATAWQGPRDWLPGGDEPHYLIITQSLLEDGDLRIENNHQRGDYGAYFNGELRPDYLRRGVDRQIYSIHAPGLPALLVPAFALGGYVGSVWFLIACNALGAGLAWHLARRVAGDAGAAWAGWASVALSFSVLTHGYMVFPDAVSGVLLLVGIWGLLDVATLAPLRIAGLALVLGALPWFHTRNALLVTALGAAIALRLFTRADRARALAAFVVPAAACAIAWLAFFKVIYGVFDPSAPYGGYTQSALEYVASGLAGLLVDQQYGLLANAPACLLVGCGFVAMLSRTHDASASGWRRLAVELLIIVVPYALVTASYRMWWGGASGPARFLVPALLPLALPAAVAWTRLRTPHAKALGWGLLLGNAVMIATRTWPGDGLFAMTLRARYAPMQQWATRAVDLSSALPALLRDPLPLSLGIAAIWCAALAAWWLALRVTSACSRPRAAAWAVPLGVLVASLAMTAAWWQAGVMPLRPDASRLAAVDRVDPDGLAFVLGRKVRGLARRPAVAEALPLLEMRTTSREALPAGQRAVVGPLPAGRYRVTGSAQDAATELVVSVGRSGWIERREAGALRVPGGAGLEVELPVRVDSLVVWSADPADVAFAPVAIAPTRSLPSRDVAYDARRFGASTVFLLSDGQFPERDGMWLRADGDVPVVLRRDDPGRDARLFLRNGPTENTVTVRSGAWSETKSLAPSQEVEVVAPPSRDATAALLVFRVGRWWRPSQFDPSSNDTRRLGVWVEFR